MDLKTMVTLSWGRTTQYTWNLKPKNVQTNQSYVVKDFMASWEIYRIFFFMILINHVYL